MKKRRRRRRHRFLAVIAVLRMAILLVAPGLAALDYGGVLPWTQWALGCAALALLALTIPEWFRAQRRPRAAILTTLALLVATCALLQTVRLPSSLTTLLSRGSSAAYRDNIPISLREEALQSGNDDLRRLATTNAPVSLAPGRTLAACTIPVLFAVFLVAAACTFESKTSVVIMLFALAVSGAAISCVGIMDRIKPTKTQQAESANNNNVVQKFGTFVNRNNAAVYLNLALAAAAGCLVWRYSWQRSRRPWDDRFEFDEATLLERVKKRIQQLVEYIDTPIVLILMIVGVILAGLFISGSRGGVLGIVAGVVIFAVHAITRQQTRAFAATTAVGVVLLAVILGTLGSLDQVRARTSSLWKDDFSESARFNHWRDAVPTALHYLPAGAGLGAYRYSYLPYQQHSSGAWFQNADNLYLEMFVEGGLWLPLLFVIGSFVALTALFRLSHIKKSPTTSALVAAGAYLFASMAVSQFFDFGVILPANYLVIAIVIGALLGHADNKLNQKRQRVRIKLARKKRSSEQPTPPELAESSYASSEHTDTMESTRRKSRSARDDGRTSAAFQRVLKAFSHRLVNPTLAVLLFVFLLIITNDAKARARVDYWQRTAVHLQQGDPISSLALDPGLLQLAADHPLDTEAQLAIAQWRLLISRSHAVQASQDRSNVLANTSTEAWKRSAQPVIRAIVHAADEAGRRQVLAAILSKTDMEELRKARSESLIALLSCPLNVAARELLIQLDYLDPAAATDASDTSAKLLEQIKRLQSRHAWTLHQAAKLAYTHPGQETAFSLWRQALELNPEFIDLFWRDTNDLMDEPTFVGAIPDDPYICLRFAELAQEPKVREQMLERSQQLLISTPPPPQDAARHHYVLGRIAELKNNFPIAETQYALAVAADPTETDWRYRYVIALEKNGRIEEAKEQIKRCLLQDNMNVNYQKKKAAFVRRRPE